MSRTYRRATLDSPDRHDRHVSSDRNGRRDRRDRPEERDAHQATPSWSRWSAATTWSRRRDESFRCRQCKQMVFPPPSGGRHRNHCPFCLYSRHVDGRTPGDRASDCGGKMAPIGVFARPNGEQAIVHRCLACGFERFNRVAADDSIFAVMALPLVEPLRPRPAGTAARNVESGAAEIA